MSVVNDEFAKLKLAVLGVEGDVAKAGTGNKSAGTRVRKVMQEVKAAAQAIRKGVLAGEVVPGGAAVAVGEGDKTPPAAA